MELNILPVTKEINVRKPFKMCDYSYKLMNSTLSAKQYFEKL